MSLAEISEWCQDGVLLLRVLEGWRRATEEGQWERLRVRRARRQAEAAEAEAIVAWGNYYRWCEVHGWADWPWWA